MKPSVIPSVSVIIPTRNSGRTMESCLTSIRRQTVANLDLLVIDNNSTDATVEIAGRFANRVENGGPERSAQRNLGARLATGDFLLFIDSDMVLDSTVVEECLEIATVAKVAAVVIPEVTIGVGYWARCRALERSCYHGDDLVEAARFFPRSVFESAGGFDEEMTGVEDWDLTLRVKGQGKLARTSAQIVHDEGELRLATCLAKKRYYGATFRPYLRKHGLKALKQANIVARPAFFRNWRRLAKNPTLTLGLLTLKCLELGAALTGVLFDAQRPGGRNGEVKRQELLTSAQEIVANPPSDR